jgi:hypothetical protein
MSIARHKALSARHRRTNAELDEKIEATIADPANDPELALQEKDRSELVRRALMRLSSDARGLEVSPGSLLQNELVQRPAAGVQRIFCGVTGTQM